MTFVETDPRHDPPSAGHDRRLVVLAVMCVALIAVVGMLVSLAVALPGLGRDLGATEAQLQWVMNSYGVAFAGLLLPAGALGDRYGRKGGLLAGLLVFAGASLGVLWVEDTGLLIALRAAAGMGAALVMPMTLSIITNVFPPEERGRAVGVWSGVFGGGGLVGILVAGGLLEAFSWRSLFAFNAALAAAALVATALLVRTSRNPDATPLDLPGAALSVTGVTALVFSIVEGPERGWSDPLVIAGFAVAAAGFALFAWWELRARHPMLDLRVFRLGGVSGGSLVILVESLVTFGLFFLILQFLQQILGYTAFEAGLGLLPLAVAMIVISPTAPRLGHRYGLVPVVGLGLVIIAGGLVVLSLIDAGSGFWPVAVGGALIGTGVAYAATPATDAIVAALPPARQGVAAALNDVSRELGAVLGIAILGSIFNSGYRAGVTSVNTLPAHLRDTAADSLAGALLIAERIGGRPGAQLEDATKDAFAGGMSSALLAGVVIVVLGGACSLLLLRLGTKRSDA
ncbi:MFS transporter [Actinomadura geliboluensis]|uniref:MFS transporter n=1 Tax=Actinomadura geliboluensis TaxID=882440 RepID=A0A5S4HC00_9ACTN|nr:MFS transporter [Actinomadura geliboluensis]TMR42254.1 MFS transporter [Actinomadura geliboluensis]